MTTLLFCLGLGWISVEGGGALVNTLASEVGGALCIVGSALEVGGPAIWLFALPFLVACKQPNHNN